MSVDALLVVDMQVGFVSGADAVPGHVSLLAAITTLLDKARAARVPVIFLQNDGEPGTVDHPSQPGWTLYFTARAEDHIVRKAQDNGFDGTSLDPVLKTHGVRSLAICGVLSEMCVAATARAALEHGYDVVIPHDAHATYDVPAGPGSEPVPAAMAARAAEWSLGDEIRICASASDVQFIARQR
ncbi:isochorismatase family protein [Pandoraea pulmonicola]|nr:isochorismatase family protein [Pandoraea pulmonicola]